MKMLKIALVLFFFGFTIALQAQESPNAIDKYFSQYVDDNNFTVVYISPKMFQMLDKLKLDGMEDADEKAILDIAKDLRGLRILTTEVNPKGYYKEAKSKINTKEYEVLMTVRDHDGDNVEFLVKDEPCSDGNIISELLLLSGGEDEFVLISFVGKISLDKISRLANSIEDKDKDKSRKY